MKCWVYSFNMWNFAASCVAGNTAPKNDSSNPLPNPMDCSDDEASSVTSSRGEALECPICWESFNLVENIPYVLWCGHTLCKNCILGLQSAVVKFPSLPLQLPLFISCPWCNLLSPRFVYKGSLKFPRKNFFLLWMLESMNGDRCKSQQSQSSTTANCINPNSAWQWPTGGWQDDNIRHLDTSGSLVHNGNEYGGYHPIERLQLSLKKSLVFFVHLTAKFPLVMIFLLIILYAIPASAAILALYIVITIVFALPSFLILYFAYPSLDWLVREIIT